MSYQYQQHQQYQQQHQQQRPQYQRAPSSGQGLTPQPHSPAGGYFSGPPSPSNAYPQSPGQQYGNSYHNDSFAASRDNLYSHAQSPPARPYSPAMSMYAAAAAAESRTAADPFRDVAQNDGQTPELAADSMHTGMDGKKRWSTYPPNSDRYDSTKPNKKAYIITAVVIGILIAAGVAAGIVITRLHKKNGSGSSTTSSSSINGDPSNFQKDSRLHNSFWGMAYSPIGSQYQYGCNCTLDDVIQDVQTLSQLTTRVRLYGADCNVTALVLQAVQDTKVNLTIYPAIYLNQVADDPQELAWTRQVNNITYAFQNYGVENVAGVAVGNEFILDGGKLSDLSDFVSRFRTVLSTNKWNVPVGTADAASVYTSGIAAATDFFMANDHAYFAGVTVQDAPGWTWNYFEDTDVSVAKKASNKPDVYIGETGWPSNSSDAKGFQYKGSIVSMPNFQYYINNFVCAANANGTQYFWFELYDEAWKDVYGGVEPWWGLFDRNRQLKQITIPNCAHS